mmetsp:Transcript_11967/g.34295  ORF Transcript_11967/g.34295 Transcript_11967/m.34295 type:complete len:243 (+) Transcript_11967:88-816(+)
MRFYNGGLFGSYYTTNVPAPSNNSSFPSVAKNKSINLPEDRENYGNANVSVANNRRSSAQGLGLSYRSTGESVSEDGVCELVYEPDSSGRLVEHYTKTELQGKAIVGRWSAGAGKKIAGFKFKRNAGRNVLIGNCSAGVLGRKNYCNGFCQFVKQAKLMKGDVTLYEVPTGFKSMPVDVYLYYDDNRPGYQNVKLVPGKAFATENLLAVACLPKNTAFYEHETVDLLKWLHDAEVQGYSSRC